VCPQSSSNNWSEYWQLQLVYGPLEPDFEAMWGENLPKGAMTPFPVAAMIHYDEEQ
jgi:hypothetical protein